MLQNNEIDVKYLFLAKFSGFKLYWGERGGPAQGARGWVAKPVDLKEATPSPLSAHSWI